MWFAGVNSEGPSSKHDAHAMGYPVVGQRNVRGDLRQRVAIQLQVSDSTADPTGVLDRNLVVRRVVPESDLVTSPATRYAGIEEERFAAQTKPEYPPQARPLHPSATPGVPNPT